MEYLSSWTLSFLSRVPICFIHGTAGFRFSTCWFVVEWWRFTGARDRLLNVWKLTGRTIKEINSMEWNLRLGASHDSSRTSPCPSPSKLKETSPLSFLPLSVIIFGYPEGEAKPSLTNLTHHHNRTTRLSIYFFSHLPSCVFLVFFQGSPITRRSSVVGSRLGIYIMWTSYVWNFPRLFTGDYIRVMLVGN